jgi:hypothetical protein
MLQINYRYPLINVTAYASRVSPKANYNYRVGKLDDVCGRWVDGCKPPFRAISEDYFVHELPHELISEGFFFCLLALTTLPPLINAASAVLGILKAF